MENKPIRIIDINNQVGVNLILYPDNQPHVILKDVSAGDDIWVKCSIKSSLDLIHLIQCANAIDNRFANKRLLLIPYLMAARFDRIMQEGDSFDLRVISDLINYMQFEKVVLFDVHSDVATALIKNSVNTTNQYLVNQFHTENCVLICPDAGAAKKINKYLEWNREITDVVYCNKSRDLTNGNITLTVTEPHKCHNRNCVIIDDLCDGGGTFMLIAKQIRPVRLSLIVTHGVFSKGTKLFEEYFDEIITSNSYCQMADSGIVKIIPLTDF